MIATRVEFSGHPILTAGTRAESCGYEDAKYPGDYILVDTVVIGSTTARTTERTPNTHARRDGVTTYMPATQAERLGTYITDTYGANPSRERNCAGFVLNVLGYTDETYVDIDETLHRVEEPNIVSDAGVRRGIPYGFGNHGRLYHLGLGVGPSRIVSVDGWAGPLVLGPPEFHRYGQGDIYPLDLGRLVRSERSEESA